MSRSGDGKRNILWGWPITFETWNMHEPQIIIWLAPRAGKMNQIVRCDWLPERARWSHLARSGQPPVSRKQNFTKSHIINSLLTKFVRLRWLDIGLVFFCEFMDLDFVSVHKHAKKELGQYPAILTSHLVNNPYIMCMMCMVLSPNCCAVTIFEYSTNEVTLPSCWSVPSEHVASH